MLILFSWLVNGFILYIFGIDVLGRDLFICIIYGCCIILGFVFIIVVFVMLVGVSFGIFVGMLWGVCLSIVNYLFDVFMVIFMLFIVIIIVVILGIGLVNSMWVIIFVFIL